MAKSGYQEITSSNKYLSNLKTREIDATENQAYAEWQLRISLLPTPDNLRLAQDAFRTFLRSNIVPTNVPAEEDLRRHPLPFRSKILYLEENIDNIPWDPSFAEQGTNRNQMGKELCLYMPFYFDKNKTLKNVYSVSEWKDVILKIIAAMQANGVRFGQSGIPFGDKGIFTLEGFRLPVTYTSFKPYQNRWGILHEGNYNPHSEHPQNDPLNGLTISAEDLKKYQINAEKLFMGLDVPANLQLMYRRKIKDFIIKTQQIGNSNISIDNQINKVKTLGDEVILLLNANGEMLENKLKELYLEIKTLQDIDAAKPQVKTGPSIMELDGSVAVSKRSQKLMDALNSIFYKGVNDEFQMNLENAANFKDEWSELMSDFHAEIDVILESEYEQVQPQLVAILEEDGIQGLKSNTNILYKGCDITILNDNLSTTFSNLLKMQPRKMQCLYTLLTHAIHDYLYYKTQMEVNSKLTQKLLFAIKDISSTSTVHQDITGFIGLLKKGNPIATSYFLGIGLDNTTSTRLLFSNPFKSSASTVIKKAIIESYTETYSKTTITKSGTLGL
jgi:hypothetical protein